MSLRIDTTNLHINKLKDRLLALVKSSHFDLFRKPPKNTFHLAMADFVFP